MRRAAHTLSRHGRKAARRRRPAGRRAVEHLQHPRERRLSVSDGHAERRPNGEARSGRRSQICARCRTARDREKVMSAFFTALGGFSRTFGTTMNARSAEGAVLHEGAPVRERARDRARRSEHPGVGLHAAHRRRQPEPARVPPLPEAAQADDGRRRAALLRSLRAARRLGEARVHAGGGAEARARRGRAARRRTTRRRFSERSTSAGSICCRTTASARARTRTAARTTSIRTC